MLPFFPLFFRVTNAHFVHFCRSPPVVLALDTHFLMALASPRHSRTACWSALPLITGLALGPATGTHSGSPHPTPPRLSLPGREAGPWTAGGVDEMQSLAPVSRPLGLTPTLGRGNMAAMTRGLQTDAMWCPSSTPNESLPSLTSCRGSPPHGPTRPMAPPCQMPRYLLMSG